MTIYTPNFYPRINAEKERIVPSLLKVVQTAHESGYLETQTLKQMINQTRALLGLLEGSMTSDKSVQLLAFVASLREDCIWRWNEGQGNTAPSRQKARGPDDPRKREAFGQIRGILENVATFITTLVNEMSEQRVTAPEWTKVQSALKSGVNGVLRGLEELPKKEAE